MTTPLSALFLASEAEPFVKVGGLSDVAGSLPRALHQQGLDIRLAIPLHGSIQREQFNLRPLISFPVPHRGGTILAEAYTTEIDGMDLIIIRDGRLSRNEVYFDRMALVGTITFFKKILLYLCYKW